MSDMEKYGVEETPDDSKTASTPGCPKPGCDKKIEKHGEVHKCPVHGTEPFEKKDDEQ